MRSLRSEERGQAVVIVALTMTAMLMVLGLAVDAGQLYVARRTAQEAADAGAYAGAVVLYQGGTTTQAIAAATNDVGRNGYTDGGDGGLTEVTVNLPPQSGPHTCALQPTVCNTYVEVIISTQVRTALVPAQSQLNLVSVRGVAGAEPLNNAYAIMALDRGNTEGAMSVGPQGTVDIEGAGILVNSTHEDAARNLASDEADNITVLAPYGTDVAGGTEGEWPNATTGAPQRPDPFASFPRPSVDDLTVHTSLPSAVNGIITLYPGVYEVPISAAGGTIIQMNSGVYVTKQGINGSGNADLQSLAGGVFIFNTVTGYPGTTGSCAAVRLTGNAASVLHPLTTPPYAGLLFYQDTTCTAQFVIAGNGTLTASGTIYLPTAEFYMDGSNATLTGSQLIANTVNIQNGNISIEFNAGTTAQPVLPRLSE